MSWEPEYDHDDDLDDIDRPPRDAAQERIAATVDAYRQRRELERVETRGS